MTMHPAQLRAHAALWSLHAALHVLQERYDEDAAAIAAEQQAAAEPLRSPTYGTRQALGGHGDPTGDAIGTIGTTRANRWAGLRTEVLSQIRDVAQHLPGLDSPLARLQAATPHMNDRMADATRHLADRLDTRIRRLLRLPFDRQIIPRTPCPNCDSSGLTMRLSPPAAQRVIECATCGRAWISGAVLRSVAA